MIRPNTPLSVVIIDQDPEERACMRRILESQEFAVVGEAAGGEEALTLIQTMKPLAAIIDVRLADMSGFELLDALNESRRPHVIFISDGNADAARAFEYHAVDYLVKPCVEERFEAGTSKLQERLRGSNGKDPESYMERIVVKSRDRIYFVRLDEVTWIEAAADYVHVHAAGQKHIVRAKISDLERRLDPRKFVRIHRSTIVNLDRICELRPLYHGEYQVVLKDNTELTLSRGYKGRFSQYLMNPV